MKSSQKEEEDETERQTGRRKSRKDGEGRRRTEGSERKGGERDNFLFLGGNRKCVLHLFVEIRLECTHTLACTL